MACSTCPPSTAIPVPLPDSVPCPEGENCEEVISTDCVVYPGPALPELGVENGMDVSTILQLLYAFLNTPAAQQNLYLANTNTVKVTGTGILTDAYKFRTVLVPGVQNLLKATPDGLQVVLDEVAITAMLTLIKTTPSLQTLFCSICAQPQPVCQMLQISLGVPQVAEGVNGTWQTSLSWVIPTPVSPAVDALPILYQRRTKYGSPSWVTVSNVPKTSNTLTATNLLYNTIYQFKLVNTCSETDTTDSAVAELCYVAPIPDATITTTTTSATVAFSFQGADTDAYELRILSSTRTLVTSATISLPLAPTISQLFQNLTPGTTYFLQVVGKADQYQSTVFEKPFSTASPTPVCSPVTNVIVTLT